MKGFEFSNLCGTVYKRGNVLFTPDGNCLVSPVGNRVTVFDLVNNKSTTLPFENRKDIARIALSPSASLLLAVDEDGRALLVNFRRRAVLHHFNFKEKVYDVQFSPNGRFFAVTHGKHVQVWRTPALTVEFAPFVLHRTYTGHYDDVLAIQWSPDSRFFISSSRDLSARLYSLDQQQDFTPVVFAGHREKILGTFFSPAQDTIYTVSRDGAVFVWQPKPSETGRPMAFAWQISARHYFHQPQSKVTSVAFHAPSQILVAGFSTGIFGLYEMPDCTNIHTLSISQHKVSACAINNSGEWLAFGSPKLGQLLVWEWQSESYVLRQQGHTFPPSCVSYNPDGQTLVTGGEDGRVKLWNATSGFCFVTFHEHSGPVTAVEATKTGQVVVSASKDGTVRAFDLMRYRNFRTFTTPQPLSLVSLAVDVSGELVCAGSEDSYEIFLWSMQTGKLLDVLAGHEGPVTSLAFSPVQAGMLASGSWDATVRLWDVFGGARAKDILKHGSDCLALAFRPDGQELAVATLDGQITLWNVRDAQIVGVIDGRRDIAGGKLLTDRRSVKNTAAGKAFSSLVYSADGRCILAGGSSKHVCIYETRSRMLVKKFTISTNQSLDGVREFISGHDMTEAGPLGLIDVDHSDEEATDKQREADSLRLPGVLRTDLSTRKTAPAVRTYGVRFSPTGRAFACATTEGLMIYSIDDFLLFDPMDLELELTPQAVLDTIARHEWLKALVMALRLNEEEPLEKAYLAVPAEAVPAVAKSLSVIYMEPLLKMLTLQIEKHPFLEYHLLWLCELLGGGKGPYVQQRRVAMAPTLRALHKAMTEKRDGLTRICESNIYSLKYLLQLSGTTPTVPLGASATPASLDAALAMSDQLLRDAITDTVEETQMDTTVPAKKLKKRKRTPSSSVTL